MPRTLIPRGFTVQEPSPNGPSLALANAAGHRFSVHAISASTIRVVHELPSSYPQKSVQWEHAADYVRVEVSSRFGGSAAPRSDLADFTAHSTRTPLHIWTREKSKLIWYTQLDRDSSGIVRERSALSSPTRRLAPTLSTLPRELFFTMSSVRTISLCQKTRTHASPTLIPTETSSSTGSGSREGVWRSRGSASRWRAEMR